MTKETTNPRASMLSQIARVSGVVTKLGEAVLGRTDSFSNPLTGLGTSRDKVTYARVTEPTPLSDEEVSDLYRGNPFARRVCAALPRISLRQGVRLKHPNAGDNPEQSAQESKRLVAALKKFRAIASVRDADTWGRAYGRAAILLGVDGAGPASTPYDPNVNPGRLVFISVLEKRDFSCAEVHPDTGLPMLWRLNLPQGTTETLIHDSRLIMFGGDLTSSRVRIRNGHADDSVLTMAYEPIRDLNTMWGSYVHLVSDSSQGVFTVKGFFEMLTSGNVDPLLLRLSMMDMSRSSVRGVVVDAEDEKFERISTDLSGLPPALQIAFQYVAATAEMPVTELMGMSPAGLNATGESDTRSWYAKAETHQTDVLSERLELLVNLVAVSEGLAPGWVVEFPSLWTMTPPEQAAFRKTVAETDKIEIDGGVLLAEEVATHRHSGSDEAWTTPIPIDLSTRANSLAADLAKVAENDNQDPNAAPVDPNAAPVDPLAKDPATALNGAQVSSLLEIVNSVATKQLPRPTGLAMLLAAFPLTKDQAEAIMGEVGRTFFADAPAAPTGPGKGGNPFTPDAPTPDAPKTPQGAAPSPEADIPDGSGKAAPGTKVKPSAKAKP